MAAKPVPVYKVTRNGVQDLCIHGSVVVVNDAGKILFQAGDPKFKAFIRSSEKPIQALPMLMSDAPKKFKLEPADIGIICGSHKGKGSQVRQVRSILKKIGLKETDLICGAGIKDNCSGKHSGMLTACKFFKFPTKDYVNPKHPHQKNVLKAVKTVCQLPGEVHIAIDGCSAPIHYMPLYNMALGYARMSRPEKHFDAKMTGAIQMLTKCMWTAPKGHTGEPLYRTVLKGNEPRMITKGGGAGVYCASFVGKGIGFAAKFESGSDDVFGLLHSLFFEISKRVGCLTKEEAAKLEEKYGFKVKNRRKQTVGDKQLLI